MNGWLLHMYRGLPVIHGQRLVAPSRRWNQRKHWSVTPLSLKFWPMLLRILLYKKQRLPRKYLLQLYSNCCYTGQWQNLVISSTTWRWARMSYLHTWTFLHKSSHITFRISCVTSVDAFVLLHKRFISSLYIKFLHFQIFWAVWVACAFKNLAAL